jgi:hypothetical protein
MTTPMVRCVFCGLETCREEAIKEDWEPMFWRRDRFLEDAAACHDCANLHLGAIRGPYGFRLLEEGHEEFMKFNFQST